MIETKVAIVGGGLAGLHAARLLHRAGVDFVLLEARDRFGGRILSVDESGQPSEDGFDLGPSWFWPRMQPAIAALVAELGLAPSRKRATATWSSSACRGRRRSAIAATAPTRNPCGSSAARLRSCGRLCANFLASGSYWARASRRWRSPATALS